MDKEEVIKYSYYNDNKEYCVVLDGYKLRSLFAAKNIYIDTEE